MLLFVVFFWNLNHGVFFSCSTSNNDNNKPSTCATARNMDAFKLMKELKVNHEQEVHYLPKETGLHLIESTVSVSTTVNSHWALEERVKRC